MVLCSIFASLISFNSCVVFLIEYIIEEENLCEKEQSYVLQTKLTLSLWQGGQDMRWKVTSVTSVVEEPVASIQGRLASHMWKINTGTGKVRSRIGTLSEPMERMM